jgi:parallel beta helix pectate lyase-like protein
VKSLIRVVFGVSLSLGIAASAQAQATRTWVSGVGDDVNPCSRTAPCKTFAGAISKTATGGFINVLDPGGFGTITITKSITIDGGSEHAGLLAAGAINGVNVGGAGIKVILRNLSIESPASVQAGLNGIRVTEAAEVHVENCIISGFSANGIQFQPSGGGELYVDNTMIANVTGDGIRVQNGRAMINNYRSESNGAGVIVAGVAIAMVRNSYAAAGGVGFGVTAVPSAVMNLENSTAMSNAHGVMAESGGTVRVSNSHILSNSANGLLNSGGASFLVSLGGNAVTGNSVDGAFTSTIPKQ